MNNTDKWLNLRHSIKSCQKCEGLNSKELGTENAPGYGNTNSRIIFIGQSLCGKPCIEAQIPFTGGSGKLLDLAFEQANIEKKDIYITNVVKCHPDGNRKSEPHEIANCSPYLEKELSWLSPKIIICLGKDAWAHIDPTVFRPCVKPMHFANSVTHVHFVYHPSFIMKKPKAVREEYIRNLSKVIVEANT